MKIELIIINTVEHDILTNMFQYYFIKFAFMKKYVEMEDLKILLCFFWLKKKCIHLKTKAFRANVEYMNYVAEYGMHFLFGIKIRSYSSSQQVYV